MGSPSAFWSLVDVRGAEECWPYTGHIDDDGYGKYRGRGAHREAFRLANGGPAALHVLHTCDNPPCCNPKHLFEGTHQQNMADRDRKGRGPAGARNGRYKSGLYVGGLHRPRREAPSTHPVAASAEGLAGQNKVALDAALTRPRFSGIEGQEVPV